MQPSFKYEQKLWQQNIHYVAGIDEVGRGALAGPVTVAAVIFKPKSLTPKNQDKFAPIKDSKLLTPKKRQFLARFIKKTALYYSIASSSPNIINRQGIVKATQKAMRRAISKLPRCQFVLCDHFYVPYLKGITKKNQLPLTHGEHHSFSIAAASITAKVHRDRLMTRLAKKHPQYHWERNKGYATLQHTTKLSKNTAPPPTTGASLSETS